MHPLSAALIVAAAASGALAATAAHRVQQTAPGQRSFPEASTRGNTRIFYWGQTSSAGQLTLDYGTPAWKEEYDKQFESTLPRWRFGQNFWTNLDTNIDLSVGGVEVEAGYYYLVIERPEGGDFQLVLLEPWDVREQFLDAFHAAKTSGGIEVPLTHERLEEAEKQLKVTLLLDRGKRDLATLEVRFGPHRLTAEVEMHPVDP